MRTIKLYITCSEELALDKNVIGNLVRQLNTVNNPKGISIELWDCEDYDLSDAVQSDMFVALFHKEADKLSFDGVEKANEAYSIKKSPKVFIYFKDLGEGETTEEELTRFKQHLCDELGHFVNRYFSEDSIKFSILMQVMQVEGTEKAKIEESKVVLGEEIIADLTAIPFAEKNESYREILSSIESVENEIIQLQSIQNVTPNDVLGALIQQKKIDRERLIKQLEKKGADLMDTASAIASMSNTVSSKRLRQAIEYFEQGENEKAKFLLDPKIIADELAHNVSMVSVYNNAASNNINELRLRIKLDTSEKAPGWLSLCISNYETILRYTKGNPRWESIYIDTMTQYIFFLTQNNQIDRISDRFEKFVDFFRMKTLEHKQYCGKFANFLVNYGWYYYKTYNYGKAERLYSEALAVYDEMEWKSQSAKAGKHAEITRQLANIYFKQNFIKKADKTYKQAMSTYADLTKIDGIYFKGLYETILSHTQVLIKQRNYKKVVEACTLVYGVYSKWANEHVHFKVQQAYTLSQLGLANYGLNSFEQSVENYSNAVRMYRELCEKSPEAYNLSLAYNLGRLGDSYLSLKKTELAFDVYNQAKEIYQSVASYASGSFEANYSYLLTKMASLPYGKKGQKDAYTHQVEEYTKALEMYRKLAIKDEQYNYSIAWTLSRLGGALWRQREYDLSLEKYNESADIYRNLEEKCPGNYQSAIAWCLSCAGGILLWKCDYSLALSDYQESFSIYRQLEDKAPGTYAPSMAWARTKIAEIHNKQNKHDDALLEYMEGLDLYRRLAESKPDSYEPEVARILSEIADIRYDMEEFNTAFEEFYECSSIYRNLLERNIGKYENKLAESLGNAANSLFNMEQYEKALPLILESVRLYEELYSREQAEYKENYLFSLHNLACTYSYLHRIEDCIKAIDQAILFSNEDPFYIDAKGEFYLEANDTGNALKMWHLVMEKDPEYLSEHESDLYKALRNKGLISKVL